eukprot:TRINITY_DN30267_c0_g1_i1.p1 TRINITY_DN30267_c0_g1~~TRINITY_DN30267_c0_g1_i1.p1  ORF type:complete len:460 (+),score=82.37 TRINITY_DN30267_c0_g1_i1:86-1465(+)
MICKGIRIALEGFAAWLCFLFLLPVWFVHSSLHRLRRGVKPSGDHEEPCAGGPVVIVCNRLGRLNGQTGGGSIMRAALVRDLQRQGKDVIILSAAEEHQGRMSWHDTARGPVLAFTVGNLFTMWHAVRRAGLVVVSGSTTAWLPVAVALAAAYGIPALAVLTQDSLVDDPETFAGPCRRWCFLYWYQLCDRNVVKNAALSLTRSEEYKELLASRIGVHCHGVARLPSQYREFLEEDSGEEIAGIREALLEGTPQGQSLLLYVGRLVADKRILLLAHNLPPRCTLVIVGDGSCPEVQAMHSPADSVVVRSGVPQATLRKYYKAADLLVSASNVETFGNTCHEALLCGTPVVVQRAGGYVSQVGTAQGELVDWADATLAADAVRRTLARELKGRCRPLQGPVDDLCNVAFHLIASGHPQSTVWAPLGVTVSITIAVVIQVMYVLSAMRPARKPEHASPAHT